MRANCFQSVVKFLILAIGAFFHSSLSYSENFAHRSSANLPSVYEKIDEWTELHRQRALFSPENGNLMTVWSGFRLIQYRGKKAEGFTDFQFSCTHTAAGLCPKAQLSIHSPAVDKNSPAKKTANPPLVIYLSGIFSESNSSTLMRQGQIRFQKRGYHVLTIPNPFTSAYLEARPLFSPGDIIEEAKLIYEIIDQTLTVLNSNPTLAPVQEIYFVGESYGAFLGAVLGGLYPQLPIKKWVLFHPPARIFDSMTRVDQVLDQNEALYFQDGCARLISEKGPWLTEMLLASKETDISERYRWKDCQSAVLGFGAFQYWLRQFAEQVDGLQPQPLLPPGWNQDLEFSKKFRFQNFLQLFSKKILKAIQNQPEIQDFNYWVTKASFPQTVGKMNSREILIFTARDDFLNQPNSWDDFSSPPQGPKLWVLPYGGHFGYSVLKSFDDLLSMIFESPVTP